MNYVQHEIDSNQSLSMLVNVLSMDVNTYIYTQMEESRLFFRVTLYVYRLDSV